MAGTTGGEADDIGGKMAKGAAWMVLFKLAERSIGLLSTIILARLLVPADFGLVAMAMSIIAALELLSAFSFERSADSESASRASALRYGLDRLL